MSKPFISVVMPVYGVEQYLNRAAESISTTDISGY